MTSAPFPRPRAGELRFTASSVFVRGVRVDAQIGVYDHERGRTQPLSVDVEVDAPGSAGADRIGETVNYEKLAAAAREIAASGHIELVETYAAAVAEACLILPGVERVRVRVEKPQALSGTDAAGVEVTAERG